MSVSRIYGIIQCCGAVNILLGLGSKEPYPDYRYGSGSGSSSYRNMSHIYLKKYLFLLINKWFSFTCSAIRLFTDDLPLFHVSLGKPFFLIKKCLCEGLQVLGDERVQVGEHQEHPRHHRQSQVHRIPEVYIDFLFSIGSHLFSGS